MCNWEGGMIKYIISKNSDFFNVYQNTVNHKISWVGREPQLYWMSDQALALLSLASSDIPQKISTDISRSRRSYKNSKFFAMLSSAYPFIKTVVLNRNVTFLLRADIRTHKRKRIMETESRSFSHRRDYICGWLYLLIKSPYQGYLYCCVNFAHKISMGQEIFLLGQVGDAMGKEILIKTIKKKNRMTTSLFQIDSTLMC